MASVVTDRASRLAESIKQAKENAGTFESMKDAYNPAELKAIVKEQTMINVSGKFTDAIDKDRVKNCPALTSDLIARIILYLTNLKVTKKANQFEGTTLLTADVKTIVLSPKKMEFIGEETKSYTAANSQLGRVTPASTCAMIASVAYKIDEKNDVDGTKRAAFHALNELAPSSALQLKMQPLGEAVSPQSMAEVTKLLDTKFKDLPATYVPFFPQLTKTVDGVKKKYPIITFTDGKVNVPIQKFIPKAIVGDYLQMAEQFNVYKTGLHNQGLKRVGKNAYLALPISEFQVEHVIALYDAGVSPGECVMVMSPDAHIVSLLRANFGLGVYGIGNGDGLIPQCEIPKYMFDWVYYPTPVDITLTGNPLDTFAEALGTLSKMLTTRVSGKVIMHINPLCFYSVNFRHIFGHTLKKCKDSKVTKINAIGPIAGYSDTKGLVFVPHNDDATLPFYPEYVVDVPEYDPPGEKSKDEKPLPVLEPEKIADGKKKKKSKAKNRKGKQREQKPVETESAESEDEMEEVIAARQEFVKAVSGWHQNRPSIQNRARQSYGKVGATLWAALQTLTLPLKLTMLSYTGTLLYVEGGTNILYRDALGLSLTYLRHVFKSIWYSTPVTNNTYTINRITRGTCVGKLVLDDDWSAMYSLELAEDLEGDAQDLAEEYVTNNLDDPPTPKKSDKKRPKKRRSPHTGVQVSGDEDASSEDTSEDDSDDGMEKPAIEESQINMFEDD